jgi:hypothetical protein
MREPFQKVYVNMVAAAPHIAQKLGYLKPSYDIKQVGSYSHLASAISPSHGESVSSAMQKVLDHTGSYLSGGNVARPAMHADQHVDVFSRDPYNDALGNDPKHPFSPFTSLT